MALRTISSGASHATAQSPVVRTHPSSGSDCDGLGENRPRLEPTFEDAREWRSSSLPRDEERPSGIRFGALVHAVLATVPLDADVGVVQRLAASQSEPSARPTKKRPPRRESQQTCSRIQSFAARERLDGASVPPRSARHVSSACRFVNRGDRRSLPSEKVIDGPSLISKRTRSCAVPRTTGFR